jgi:hypothetical protein
MNEESGRRIFDNLMNLFFLPEIVRRQKLGLVSKPLEVRIAQVVFYPDGRPNSVLLNEEVKFRARVKMKPGTVKKPGEAFFDHEVEDIDDIELTCKDGPDCAHATVVWLSGMPHVLFDFRYNKALARRHVDTARQFHRVAKMAWSERLLSPCADNLYSAAELAARAMLLTFPDPEFSKGAKHKEIKRRFSAFASLGNVPTEQNDAFQKLTQMRYPMRYLRRESGLTDSEVEGLLRCVEELIARAERFIATRPGIPGASC